MVSTLFGSNKAVKVSSTNAISAANATNAMTAVGDA
jgi:hypothetical protein